MNDEVAIIDIGSNAVRLVIYDGICRAPFRIYSERIICNLGEDLATTGLLNKDSVKKALECLGRFSGLVAAMKITRLRAVATAAVRDAKDGHDFVARAKMQFGLDISVIGGEEEARLAALGVLASSLGGNGVIGDYGGGSLELIVVENNQVKHTVSLPLGSHRLLVEKRRRDQAEMIETYLDQAGFLKDYAGWDFYAMGGAWRTMATAHMHMQQHPIRMLDHYQIEGAAAAEFAGMLVRQNPVDLEKTIGLSKKRIKDMGAAAQVLQLLFQKIQPRRLIFSGTNLREGLLYDQLTPEQRQEDALLASCEKIALKLSRFDDLSPFYTLQRWLEPLFSGQEESFMRLLTASCLLSDVSGFEPEDCQAPQAFQRILMMPFYGIDHAGRAFLALSQYIRYQGEAVQGGHILSAVKNLLDPKMIRRAEVTGLAQYLAYLLTGGALGLLEQTELLATPKQLTLRLKGDTRSLKSPMIFDALTEIAERTGREAIIEG